MPGNSSSQAELWPVTFSGSIVSQGANGWYLVPITFTLNPMRFLLGAALWDSIQTLLNSKCFNLSYQSHGIFHCGVMTRKLSMLWGCCAIEEVLCWVVCHRGSRRSLNSAHVLMTHCHYSYPGLSNTVLIHSA